MPEEKKQLPPEIQAFLKLVQENISLYPETIVYNRIKDHIPNMTTRQVAWLTSTIIISTEFRVRIFKRRCDTGDELACDMLTLTINGDPYSKNLTVRKGLIGLWQEDRDIEAAKLLVEVGRISQEDLDRSIRSGKDKELIGGRTREELLCDLAEESKEYKSGDEFSMAMIMGKLKKVPEPNTANVKRIIQGKYKSGEEFWAGVHNGELTELCKKVKEEKEIIAAAKRKIIIRPEAVHPAPTPTSIEPIPMEEVDWFLGIKKEGGEKSKDREGDLDKRLEELRKKKELEKQKEKERQEKETGKQPTPATPPPPVPTPPEIPSNLDLMKDEIEKRIAAEIKRRKASMTEGQAGESAAGYGIKKKDLSRITLLEVTGTESKYSTSADPANPWIKTPVSISIEKDQSTHVHYLLYRRGKGKERSTGYYAKTYGQIYAERYQSPFGYTVELRFTDDKNNVIKSIFDPASNNIINGVILENDHKIAEFDVDESSFRKAEQFARQNVIKECGVGDLSYKDALERHKKSIGRGKLQEFYEGHIKPPEDTSFRTHARIEHRITEDTYNFFYALLHKTKKDGNEHSTVLCVNHHGQITASGEITGGSRKVVMDSKCPSGLRTQGEFHTHPHYKMLQGLYKLYEKDINNPEYIVILQRLFSEEQQKYSLPQSGMSFEEFVRWATPHLGGPSVGDLTRAFDNKYKGVSEGAVCVMSDLNMGCVICYTAKDEALTEGNFMRVKMAKDANAEKRPESWLKNMFIIENINLKDHIQLIQPPGEQGVSGTGAAQNINPKLLHNKEIAHLSKDIEDKCIPLGYINMYSLYPKSRFGTDTAILYDCRNTDSSKLKRDTIAKGENDIIIATSSKTYMERYHPNLTKISFEHEDAGKPGAGEKFAEDAADYIIYEKNSKTPLINQLLNIQPGKIIILEYRDIPEKNAEKLKLPGYKTDVWATVIERRDNLVAVGTLAGAAVNSRLYLQKGQDLIPIRPIPHQKVLKQSGEYANTTEYEKWVERMKKEAPEYLPAWESINKWENYLLFEQKAEPKKLDLSGSATRNRYQGIVTPVIEHLSIDDVLNHVDINYSPEEYPQEQAYIDNRLIPHMKTTKLSLPVIEIYTWDQVDNQRPMLPSGKRPFTNIHILDGAHRIVALKKLGITRIPFIVYREPPPSLESYEILLARVVGLSEQNIASADYNMLNETITVTYGVDKPKYKQKTITRRVPKEFADFFKAPIFTGKQPRQIVELYLKEVKANTIAENKYLIEDPADIGDPDAWIKSKGAEFHDEVRGAHHGQVDGTLIAYDIKTHGTIGYIDYSIFEGKLYLDQIEVDPAHRRQGYATALLMKIKRLNPRKVVMWGMMTEEGCALKCAAIEQDLFRDEKEDCKDWDFGTYESLLSGTESEEELDELLNCVMSSEKLTELEIETLRKLIENKMEE